MGYYRVLPSYSWADFLVLLIWQRFLRGVLWLAKVFLAIEGDFFCVLSNVDEFLPSFTEFYRSASSP